MTGYQVLIAEPVNSGPPDYQARYDAGNWDDATRLADARQALGYLVKIVPDKPAESDS